MLPQRDPHRQLDEHPDLNVLVPGLMGIGFLISVVMLVADGFTRFVPLAGRRRAAAITKLSLGRVNDAQSIWNGAPPALGVVSRVPRRRVTAAAFSAALYAVAVAAIIIGIETAETVGVDRQLWAILTGVTIAAAATLPATVWALAAITGAGGPRRLRWLHQFWPFGVLPHIRNEE